MFWPKGSESFFDYLILFAIVGIATTVIGALGAAAFVVYEIAMHVSLN